MNWEPILSRSSNHVSIYSRERQIAKSGVTQQPLVPVETAVASVPQLEAALGSAPCVVYECGLDLVLKTISSNSFELIGIRAEHIAGKRVLWQDRMLFEDQTRLLSRLNNLNRSEVVSETHRLINDQGLPVWVAHSFRKIRRDDNSDQKTGILGCFVPLSTVDCTAALDPEVIHQFVHRIGNHFQLINLLIDSLKRHSSRLDEIEALQQTLDRAVHFTRSFSQYSQPPMMNSLVEVGDLLRSVIQSTEPFFKERNVVISSAWHGSLDAATVIGDPTLLEHAFGSVLQNAFEATRDDGRLVVDCRTEARESGGSVVRVSVIDDGAGMDPNEITKAAIPFSTSKRDCDGLGLSSVFRIIAIHGGMVNIKSKPGHGTEVEIVLPIDDDLDPSNRYYQR